MSLKRLSTVCFVIVSVLALICAVGSGVVAATFYVSPTGSDSNPGTLSQPFATITKARDAVRTYKSSGQTEDITVYIRGGRYNLTSTISLGVNDSGMNGYKIKYCNYPGETPILVAGPRITNWEHYSGGIYRTQTTAVRMPPGYFQLLEDGRPGITARGPNEGWFRLENPLYTPSWSFCYKAGDFNPTGWDRSQLQVHLVHMGTYNSERFRVTNLDTTQRRLTINTGAGGDSFYNPASGKCYRIENALELLDAPGEFYADYDADYLYYYPTAANIDDAVIEACNLDVLVSVSGSSTSSPVHDIVLEGLQLEGSKASRQYQLNVGHSYNITVKDCRFLYAGGFGIAFDGHNNTITGCEIAGCFEYGIIIGGYVIDDWVSPAIITCYDNTITNNYIHNIGRECLNGTAINLQFVGRNTEISHNLITDAARMGVLIFTPWNQAQGLETAADNVVSYNEFARCNNHTYDGGSIMLGGTPENNTFLNNRITNTWTYFNTTWPQPEDRPDDVCSIDFDPGMLGCFNTQIRNNMCYGANAHVLELGVNGVEQVMTNNYFENPDSPGQILVNGYWESTPAFNQSLVSMDIGLAPEFKYWYPKEITSPVQLPLECGFEGTFSPFYLWQYNDGFWLEYFTKSRVHGGDFALQVDKEVMAVRYRHPSSISTRVSIWMYDNPAKTGAKCYMTLRPSPTSSSVLGLGVNGASSTSRYVFRNGTSTTVTSINRTAGWHELAFNVHPTNGCTATIDGQTVGTASTFRSFSTIEIGDSEFTSDSRGITFDDLYVAQPGAFTGTVNLADFNGDITSVPVTVQMTGPTTIIQTVNLSPEGRFSITGVPNGTYSVWIKASHWLAKKVTSVVVNNTTNMPVVTLVNGDAVASNEVDFDDFNAVVAAFGALPGDSNWNTNADLNGTGEVDFDDFNLVVARFGEIGDF